MKEFGKSVQCKKCWRLIRPTFTLCKNKHLVCPNCHVHQGVTDYNACTTAEFSFPILDVMFENAFDECQFGCGFVANLLDLKSHENDCLLLRKYECQNCPNGAKKTFCELNIHFQKYHEHLYVDLSSTDYVFYLRPTFETMLVTRYHHGNKFNEVFWLKYSAENKKNHITLQHLCDFGVPEEGTMKISEFEVSSPLSLLQKKTYTIKNLELTTNSIDVTSLSGEPCDFKVKSLKCGICLNTTEFPVENCSTGYSFCGKCAQDAVSPIQLNLSSDVVVACKNWYAGCSFKGIQGKTNAHEKECVFQTSECAFKCNWEGPFCNIYTHWRNSHSNLSSERKQATLDSNALRTWSRISADNFMLVLILKENVYYISVFHLTLKKQTHFYFDLQFKKPNDKYFIEVSGRCKIAKPGDLNSDEFLANYCCCRIPQDSLDKVDFSSKTLQIYLKTKD